MVRAMKWIDIPPMWLLGCAVLAWFSRTIFTAGAYWLSLLGTLLVLLGVVIMVVAVIEMSRRRTTPIPHMEPTALVTTGVFGISRNPIYLGDAIILTGLSLRWDAPLGLLIVPLFVWIIHTRFITAEEARLRAAFGAAFDTYAARTRRWV